MKRPVFYLAGALFLLAGLLVLYRVIWLGYPVLPTAPGITWQLLIDAHIVPLQEESTLSLGLPLEHTGTMIVEERVFSGMYTFNTLKLGPNRIGIWSGSGVSRPEEITYQATILIRPRRDFIAPSSPLLSPYPPAMGPEEQQVIEKLASPWETLAPPARLQAVTAALKGAWRNQTPPGALLKAWQVLLQQHDRRDIALALLTAATLPARAVEGLRLAEEVQPAPSRWIEVWTGQAWSNLDHLTGELYQDSAPLLPLAVGGLPAFGVTGAEIADIRWIMSRRVMSQWQLHFERIIRSEHLLDRWSLFQLPRDFQDTFRILLLVPIGALMISLLRNIVGLPTFGIFMPVLMSLAFRSTGLLYGIAIFCGVLLIGFLARRFLDRFHLLLVPRLSVILTLVIACFTLLALTGNRFGLREFMAVGLIPFVILTMTIERFFVVVEEAGAKEALLTTAGSSAVSIITYGIISWEPLQLTFFVYPELILAVAALQILVGCYTGYRLSELIRFRSLGGPP